MAGMKWMSEEDFIKPFLEVLGYRKGTDYDVSREESHPLHKPFLMIGRKRISIDYALIIRKKQFWLIEAKPSSPKKIEEAAIFQAHYYSLHPEVNARYFAITNGWELKVYDSRNIDESYQPLLSMKSSELPQRFLELNNILGAKNIVPMLKKRVLDDIRDILSVEVMDERLQEFSTEVTSILESVRPLIWENRLKNNRQKSLETNRKLKQILLQGSCEEIVKSIFQAPFTFEQFNLINEVFASKFKVLDDTEKAIVVRTIVLSLRGLPSMDYRRNLIHLLIKVLPGHEVLSDHSDPLSYFKSIADEIKSEIKSCLNHFEKAPWLREVWELEGNLYRTIYKSTFCSNDFLDFLNKRIKLKQEILADEELMFQNPRISEERMTLVNNLVHEAYLHSRVLDQHSLSQLNNELNQFELKIDNKFQERYRESSSDEKDFLFYDSYNKSYDYLNSGLFHVLCHEFDIVAPLVDDEIISFSCNILKERFEGCSINWIDVFLVKQLFYGNKFEISDNIKRGNDERIVIGYLKQLFANGNIYAYASEGSSNGFVFVKFRAWENGKSFAHWAVEGRVDIENKKIDILAFQP